MKARDEWLVCCAIAAAGELKLRDLTGEVEKAAAGWGPVVEGVTRATMLALAH
jgi:hypothetical protein